MTWQDELLRIAPYCRDSLAKPLGEQDQQTLADLKEIGLELPDDLVKFLATVEDGEMIRIEGSSQELYDLYGVYEANHPEEGTFGNFVADGTIPAGVVIIGYGPRQLLFDRDGALGGPKGAYWRCSDMSIDTDTKRVATSLEELLARSEGRQR